MAQEVFSVLDARQSVALFLGGPAERETNMRVAKVWRNMDFGHGSLTDAGVGEFEGNHLLQLFADAFSDSF